MATNVILIAFNYDFVKLLAESKKVNIRVYIGNDKLVADGGGGL